MLSVDELHPDVDAAAGRLRRALRENLQAFATVLLMSVAEAICLVRMVTLNSINSMDLLVTGFAVLSLAAISRRLLSRVNAAISVLGARSDCMFAGKVNLAMYELREALSAQHAVTSGLVLRSIVFGAWINGMAFMLLSIELANPRPIAVAPEYVLAVYLMFFAVVSYETAKHFFSLRATQRAGRRLYEVMTTTDDGS